MSLEEQIEGIERLLAKNPYMAPANRKVLEEAIKTLKTALAERLDGPQ